MSGVIGGLGSFTKDGPGALMLTGANTYGGGTMIAAGTLQLGNGAASGSILGNVVNNSVFAIDRSDIYTFAGNISGTGAFQQLGSGTTILTGTNTYSGGTTISGGTLQIGNGSTTGSIAGSVVNNSTFNIFNANTAGIATITNNLGVTQFFNTSTAGNASITNSPGQTFFFNSSTAGNAMISNSNAGFTEFANSSTAGTAAITNSAGGGTFFTDTSTAGAATITNSDAVTQFAEKSTAGNASIINNNGGETEFFETSTAGAATITANFGGGTFFFESSTGGQARFITNSGGILDISGLSSAGMTAGSIEGAGTYFLGSKTLTVGLNNLSTEVTGTIADGGVFGGTGGALIKVGTGTLTLTGPNTYSGGTSFNGGILAVNNDGNLGTGPLSFDGGDWKLWLQGAESFQARW
jgi:autotransporter-associated beta strand protein